MHDWTRRSNKNMNQLHSEWPDLQKLGLCPSVNSFAEYTRRVTANQGRVSFEMLTKPRENPSIPFIQTVHKELFFDVHPWAGTFNQSDGPDVHFGKMRGCDPAFIMSELEQLRSDTAELINYLSPRLEEHVAKIIAFHHAKFERIHPFPDGNGRVGRLLIETQMHAFFGPNPVRRSIKSRLYYSALEDAQFKSNLQPLMNLILALEGKGPLPREHVQLPFRLRLREGTPQDKRDRRLRAQQAERQLRASIS